MKRIPFFILVIITTGIMTACQKEQTSISNTAASTAALHKMGKPTGTLWADCILFGVVVAPNSFNPSAGNFDELYSSNNAFKDHVMSISETKPGDTDYNGGRWHV